MYIVPVFITIKLWVNNNHKKTTVLRIQFDIKYMYHKISEFKKSNTFTIKSCYTSHSFSSANPRNHVSCSHRLTSIVVNNSWKQANILLKDYTFLGKKRNECWNSNLKLLQMYCWSDGFLTYVLICMISPIVKDVSVSPFIRPYIHYTGGPTSYLLLLLYNWMELNETFTEKY